MGPRRGAGATRSERWCPKTSGLTTSPTLSGLSYRFVVRTDDERLGRHVDKLLAGLRGAGPAEHVYTLTSSAAGTVDVSRDGEPIAHGQRAADAVGWLVWDVNRATAEASGEHLLFHAAGLQAGGRGIVLPGSSGSGKSTLAAGLARAGLAYLSDELVALDLGSGRLLPYPKPITIKRGSFAALTDMGPPASGTEQDLGEAEEWHLSVGEAAGRRVGEACEPGFVIVPRYVAQAPTRMAPLTDTEAFFALAVNAVNFKEHGPVGTKALGELVARCGCFELTMSDLDAACRLVTALVAGRVGGSPR